MQVYLEIQMLEKESAFKHEQDVLNKAMKERDRVITRLQQMQLDVGKLESTLPILKQEKKKIHREVKEAILYTHYKHINLSLFLLVGFISPSFERLYVSN
jgi:hypothetical protein